MITENRAQSGGRDDHTFASDLADDPDGGLQQRPGSSVPPVGGDTPGALPSMAPPGTIPLFPPAYPRRPISPIGKAYPHDSYRSAVDHSRDGCESDDVDSSSNYRPRTSLHA